MTIEEIRKNKPDGATHYGVQEDEVYYYAKDYIGRWCCIDDNGDAWPCSSGDHEYYDLNLKPL